VTVVILVTSSAQEPLVLKRSDIRSKVAKRSEAKIRTAALSRNSYRDHTAQCGLPDLASIMVERVSGTPENIVVRDYLVRRMQDFGWSVSLDTFTQDTVVGEKTFSNVIAHSDPNAKKFIVLTAHFDSKWFPPQKDGKVFTAATDSAVPCAMILNMLDNLNPAIRRRESDTGLVVVFFDGEEAFKDWTDTDSVYGSRHLANKWYNEGFLDKIELFILLDLIGGANPRFFSSYGSTQQHFKRMAGIERELASLDLLQQYNADRMYFIERGNIYGIQDDHKPFENKGVRHIVHLIAYPFPKEWHKITDDGEHIDCTSIENVQSVLQVWLGEILEIHKIINM